MDEPHLFDLEDYPLLAKEPRLKCLEAPVWTENKANLIQRYLRYFVFITKHGTYIDVFAGPQSPDYPESWAAKMVLESEPKRIRHLIFFEKDEEKVTRLKTLVQGQPEKPKRDVRIYAGDMNENLPECLKAHPIKNKEATFCLIDQHTFECDWKTVELLATHKSGGHKIELFYFLAQGWLDRAIAGLKNPPDERLERWWGSDDWKTLQKQSSHQRGMMLAARLKKDFGYAYSMPYPIYEREGGGGKIMFWMIHASDHPEAPKLMVRAYNNAVAPLEPMEQLEMELGTIALQAD